MNHVLMNKLDDELSKAIQEVGGDISGAKGPWDYPEIIKQQLSVRSGSSLPSLDIKLGPGLKIEEVNGEKYILATSGALTTCTLNPPAGSYKQPIYDVIEAGTPIQSVLEALFYEILPKMPSLYNGDVIKASKAGTDQYNEEDLHSGLIPNAVYLRLYVANRQEPVYVLLSGHGLANDEINDPSQPGEHPEYTGGTSQYIQVKVSNGVITASLTDEGLAKFDKIVQLEQSITSIQNDIKVLNENVSNAVSVNELNIVKNKVNEIDNIVKTIEPQITNINSSLKTYEDAIYDIYGKINELKETINNVDLKSIENRLNVAEQNITYLTNEVSKSIC